MDVDLKRLNKYLRDGRKIYCGSNLDDQLEALHLAAEATGTKIGFDFNDGYYRTTDRKSLRWEYVYLNARKTEIHMGNSDCGEALTLDDFSIEPDAYHVPDIDGFLTEYSLFD